MCMGKKRGSVAWPPVVFWIIGLAVLFLVGRLIYIFLTKGEGATDFINQLLKFGK